MLLDGDLSLSFFAGFENDVLESDVFTLLDSDAGLTGAFDNVASGGTPAPNPRAVFLALERSAGFPRQPALLVFWPSASDNRYARAEP